MAWIESSGLTLEFNNKYGFRRLVINGEECAIDVKHELPLLEITILDGNRRIEVTPKFDGIDQSPESTRITFTNCVDLNHHAWSIDGWCRMEMEANGTIHWTAQINNRTVHPVIELLYPRSVPMYVSPQAVLIYPHHAGEKIVDIPAALASEKYRKFWRAASVPTAFGFAREINYCGLASMTWMDLTDGDLGLYVASYDPEFPVTGLRIETGGPADPWVSLSFRKYIDLMPGQTYQASDLVWAFHTGDWHQSAKKYRAWFDTLVDQATHPADLKEEVVMAPHYNFRRHEGIDYRFVDIPAMAQQDKAEFGSRHFFIAGWNHMGFDSHYPNYNPDLELGTPLQLQAGVEFVNQSGGFVTFYINSRIMDKYSEYVSTLGEKWMLRTIEKQPIYEVYGPAETFVLCPSHPEWRQYLLEFATWMCKAYGARGIYYDQLGSATPYPCYSDHDHSPDSGTAGFNRGYLDLIDQTTKRIRQIREDSFLMIENCGDLYSSKVWGSLVWNGEYYDEFFNLYKYTFPEHTLINMVTPRRIEDPVLQEKVFNQDLGRAFTLGSVFWVEGNGFRKRISDPEQQKRMLHNLRAALAVRQKIRAELAGATFQDTVGLHVPEGLIATRWSGQTNDTGLILIFNPHHITDRLGLDLAFTGKVQVKVLTSERQNWQVSSSYVDGQFSMVLPTSTFSAVYWRIEEKG